ncbi:hypothetical protein BURCENBC7_AP7988 [Burkholderia cenocepacia BC7]|nr:hypothetical protein BURCENK562V_C6885 [Burkholderia cenocepacia K56-2Valvano]ERI26527.1 hypothetical protein BURCENBC7_AP7988 [Burkholderia cenocepacia BC7]
MRHGLPSPWVAGRTAYAGWPGAEKCRNVGWFGAGPGFGWLIGQLVRVGATAESQGYGH